MIVTVTLNPAIDCFINVTGYTKRELRRADIKTTAGGKGINVSVILHRLGIQTYAYSFFGGKMGFIFNDLMKETGIDNLMIWLEDQHTRLNLKLNDGKEETEINGKGMEIPPESLDFLISQLDKKLCDNDILVLAGSIPPSASPDIYNYIMKKLAHRNVRIVVDTSGKPLLKTLQYRPFLIKPNHHELAEILGKPVRNPDEASAGARELQKIGAGNIIVSLAEMGSVLLTADGDEYRIKAPSGTVKNSVGAGDSMLAGFLAGLEKTGNFAYAHVLGTACGSATAFSDGLAEKNDIIRILREMFPDTDVVQNFFDIEF